MRSDSSFWATSLDRQTLTRRNLKELVWAFGRLRFPCAAHLHLEPPVRRFLCLLDFTQQFTSQESLQRAFGATAPPPGRSVSSVPAARPVWPPRTPAMNATPGPPVAPGTVEIAGGPKMSRSEARRLREEDPVGGERRCRGRRGGWGEWMDRG